jgi:hypothetical protein
MRDSEMQEHARNEPPYLPVKNKGREGSSKLQHNSLVLTPAHHFTHQKGGGIKSDQDVSYNAGIRFSIHTQFAAAPSMYRSVLPRTILKTPPKGAV